MNRYGVEVKPIMVEGNELHYDIYVDGKLHSADSRTDNIRDADLSAYRLIANRYYQALKKDPEESGPILDPPPQIMPVQVTLDAFMQMSDLLHYIHKAGKDPKECGIAKVEYTYVMVEILRLVLEKTPGITLVSQGEPFLWTILVDERVEIE